MPDQTTASWILMSSFAILLILRFPVALTLVGSTVITLWYLDLPIIVASQQMIQGITNYSLLAIPFFILTGQILQEGGLAHRIVAMTNVFVGRIRGGLALANSVACMIFGGMSGSAVADASAVGSVMIPMMVEKGYDADYAVGVTISSAIQGVVVPPSHNMVLYSIVAGGVSVGSMFLAGMIPGLIMLASLMITGYLIGLKRGYGYGDPVIKKQIPGIIIHGLLSFTPAVIIVSAIISGWATATEAGAIAAVYAFVLAFLAYREAPLSNIWGVLIRTFRTVLMVFFLIAASQAFGWVMAYLHLPDIITEWFIGVSDKPWVILLMINVLLLLLGGPMDMAPMILILTPILLPVCVKLGMDPIQFGIIMIFNLSIGAFTPPVGTVMLLVCNITQVSVGQFFRQSLPLLGSLLLMLMLVTYIPAISLFLV